MIWKAMQLTLLKQILLMEMDFYTHTNMQTFTGTYIYMHLYMDIYIKVQHQWESKEMKSSHLPVIDMIVNEHQNSIDSDGFILWLISK